MKATSKKKTKNGNGHAVAQPDKPRTRAAIIAYIQRAGDAGQPTRALIDELATAQEAELASGITIAIAEFRDLAGVDEDDILEGALLHSADVLEVLEDAAQGDCPPDEAFQRVAMAAERRARTTVDIARRLRSVRAAKTKAAKTEEAQAS